jgi:hypothetical protein
MGMPADDFEGDINILKSTVSWQEQTSRGVGGIVANSLRGVAEIGENAGIPTSITRLSNAIGTGINYSLMNTPFYKFAEWGGKGGESTWFKTEMDRHQRLAQAIFGSMWGAFIIGLILTGGATYVAFPPSDKKKREKFYAEGHKGGTLEINLPDGSFIPLSLTVGPISLAAPYAATAGAMFNLAQTREAQQKVLNDEAAKRGVPAGKIRDIDATDVMALAGNAMLGTIMSSRTASGLAASGMEYGVPNSRKAIASFISPLIPGLPAYQEISRAMGVNLDPHLASVWDYMVPLPTSGARMVNALGDPVRTPDDVQRVIQALTAGSYPVPIDPQVAKDSAAYQTLYSAQYSPPSINPARGYAIKGEYRPMTETEVEQYTVARGQYFKAQLSTLGTNPTPQAVKAAYEEANQMALASVGVAVVQRRTGSLPLRTGKSSVRAAQRTPQPLIGRGLIRGSLRFRQPRRVGLRSRALGQPRGSLRRLRRVRV